MGTDGRGSINAGSLILISVSLWPETVPCWDPPTLYSVPQSLSGLFWVSHILQLSMEQ